MHSLRYEPLREYLASNPASEVRLSYRQIEEILGRPLPNSVYKSHWRQWWANTRTHSQGQAWMDAGWQVGSANLEKREVVFRRMVERTAGPGLNGLELKEQIHKLGAGRPEDNGVAEASMPFRHLQPVALRMLEDLAEEQGIGLEAAACELLNRAALERRRQLLDWFTVHAPQTASDSVDLIRQDRDAR